MRKGILQSNLFYCDHLGASNHDKQDVLRFSIDRPEGRGLVEYIQQRAFSDEALGVMRTYLVRDILTSEVVAFFSLKAGLVSLNERNVEVQDYVSGKKRMKVVFDTLPGIELANFAVNSPYIKGKPDLKGVGVIVYNQFILPIVQQSVENIAAKFLYIFALPYDSLIENYKVNYGFDRLGSSEESELHKRLKPVYDQSCVFMYTIL